MARVPALLKAIAAVNARRLPGLQALVSNNFVIFVLLLTYERPSHGKFFLDLLGILVLLPLCADPLQRVPPERLGLLPLGRGQRLLLRLGALALTPGVWVAALALVAGLRAYSWTVLLGVAVMYGLQRLPLERLPRRSLLPPFPGRLGALVRKELGDLGRVLDVYVAGVLSGAALLHRWSAPQVDPGLASGVAFLVSLVLSTHAQRLLALDGPEGRRRFALLPWRGWQVLLAKDLAFLLLVALFTAPLSWTTGLSSGMMALAAGHHASLRRPEAARPWRFATAVSLGCSAVQVGLMLAAAALGPWGLPVAFLLCASSLAYYGRELEA